MYCFRRVGPGKVESVTVRRRLLSDEGDVGRLFAGPAPGGGKKELRRSLFLHEKPPQLMTATRGMAALHGGPCPPPAHGELPTKGVAAGSGESARVHADSLRRTCFSQSSRGRRERACGAVVCMFRSGKSFFCASRGRGSPICFIFERRVL